MIAPARRLRADGPWPQAVAAATPGAIATHFRGTNVSQYDDGLQPGTGGAPFTRRDDLTGVILDGTRPGAERRSALERLAGAVLTDPDQWESLLQLIQESGLIDDRDGAVASLAIHYATALSPPQASSIPPEKLLAFLDDPRPLVQVESAFALDRMNHPHLRSHLELWTEIYDGDDFRHFLAGNLIARHRGAESGTGGG